MEQVLTAQEIIERGQALHEQLWAMPDPGAVGWSGAIDALWQPHRSGLGLAEKLAVRLEALARLGESFWEQVELRGVAGAEPVFLRWAHLAGNLGHVRHGLPLRFLYAVAAAGDHERDKEAKKRVDRALMELVKGFPESARSGPLPAPKALWRLGARRKVELINALSSLSEDEDCEAGLERALFHRYEEFSFARRFLPLRQLLGDAMHDELGLFASKEDQEIERFFQLSQELGAGPARAAPAFQAFADRVFRPSDSGTWPLSAALLARDGEWAPARLLVASARPQGREAWLIRCCKKAARAQAQGRLCGLRALSSEEWMEELRSPALSIEYAEMALIWIIDPMRLMRELTRSASEGEDPLGWAKDSLQASWDLVERSGVEGRAKELLSPARAAIEAFEIRAGLQAGGALAPAARVSPRL